MSTEQLTPEKIAYLNARYLHKRNAPIIPPLPPPPRRHQSSNVDVVSHFAGAVKRGENAWQCRCPAHDDNKASLTITQTPDRWLLHCHAGCTTEEVCDAAGLKMADLFSRRCIVATYDYRNESGTLLYQAVRFVPKDFRQRRPDGKGGWLYNMDGVRRVLYRLPELLAADSLLPVFIVEGERDADRLHSLSLTATCNVGGAGKWRNEYNAPFKDRRVVIIADRDEPGRKHAKQVAASLSGIAAEIRILECPGDGVKDASDYFDAGGTRESLLAEIESHPATIKLSVLKAVDAWHRFPTEWLPDPVAPFIRETAAALGCDEAYIALPLLSAIASAVGNTRCIHLKAKWYESSVLWAVIIADSGTLKSPAIAAALEFSWKRQTQLLENFRKEYNAYEAELERWKNTPKADRVGEQPKPPSHCQHVVCSDITIEALADRLDKTRRGVLVAIDELSGWFGSFGQYKASRGSDVQHYLTMHRAGNLKVDRKQGDQTTIYVQRAAVCLTGTIQPKILARCLTPEFYANGLAARLLLAMPPRQVKRWTENEISPDTQQAMEALFDSLFGFQLDATPSVLTLTNEAKGAWIEFYNQHAQEENKLAGTELGAAWSKLEGYAARLAIAIHSIREATGSLGAFANTVDEYSIAAGVALARWFGHETERVYTLLHESPAEHLARELVDWIQSVGGRVTARELQRHSRKYPDSQSAEAALDQLVKTGLGKWEFSVPDGPGAGRPSAAFVLSPPGTLPSVDADNIHDSPGKT